MTFLSGECCRSRSGRGADLESDVTSADALPIASRMTSLDSVFDLVADATDSAATMDSIVSPDPAD
eukprot:979637-Heterocapsa_arctica.AAC.1